VRACDLNGHLDVRQDTRVTDDPEEGQMTADSSWSKNHPVASNCRPSVQFERVQ
jgi:hypothetical protein